MDDTNLLPLTQPEKRAEIILYLKELAADDPTELWQNERKRGLVSDIDQIFHFFFDDNDFDDGDIGASLLDSKEVSSIHEVKSLLDAMLTDLPNGDDADFVKHSLWPSLRAKTRAALSIFETPEPSPPN